MASAKGKVKGEPARSALSEEDTNEIDIDEAGPAGVPMKMLRGRVSLTMYKDTHHAATEMDSSVTELVQEGLRYILYGVQPRHVGIRKKKKLSLTA